MSDDVMVKIEHVSKQYRLGEIGGTTLYETFQRLRAKLFHKEDPTKKIGAKNYNKGEKFLALDDINLEIKKGERVGIIGHNGAGKSTLLKLLCRVTAPTSGTIGLNGRIASMLEVGTGFHPELTGRENVYMNGAILGMTKKEIDAKMEDIIEFSEVREFIDTPVKRYSSGMYVKLAFAVAAHLDSEIMIMDEVLAVGDINFQQKCVAKMKDAAINEGRAVLFVSHNMKTIKEFCDRVVELKNGKVVYDGLPEQTIAHYISSFQASDAHQFNMSSRVPGLDLKAQMMSIDSLRISGGLLQFGIHVQVHDFLGPLVFRLVVFDKLYNPCATAYSAATAPVSAGVYSLAFDVDVTSLVNDLYICDLVLSSLENNILVRHDAVRKAFNLEIKDNDDSVYGVSWSVSSWGSHRIEDMSVHMDRLG